MMCPPDKPQMETGQVYLTTMECECGGDLEVLVNSESGRCLIMCARCGGEVGAGERLERHPWLDLRKAAAEFLGGIKTVVG